MVSIGNCLYISVVRPCHSSIFLCSNKKKIMTSKLCTIFSVHVHAMATFYPLQCFENDQRAITLPRLLTNADYKSYSQTAQSILITQLMHKHEFSNFDRRRNEGWNKITEIVRNLLIAQLYIIEILIILRLYRHCLCFLNTKTRRRFCSSLDCAQKNTLTSNCEYMARERVHLLASGKSTRIWHQQIMTKKKRNKLNKWDCIITSALSLSLVRYHTNTNIYQMNRNRWGKEAQKRRRPSQWVNKINQSFDFGLNEICLRI